MMKIGPVVAAAAVFAIASPVCAQDPVWGTCAVFARPTDTVRIGLDTNLTGDYTIEWAGFPLNLPVQTNQPATYYARIWSEQNSVTEDKGIGLNPDRTPIGGVNSACFSFISGPTPLPVVASTHVALVRSGSTRWLYVNGQPVSSSSEPCPLLNGGGSNMALGAFVYVGQPQSNYWRAAPVALDWIRVSASARYSAAFVPPEEATIVPDGQTQLLMNFEGANPWLNLAGPSTSVALAVGVAGGTAPSVSTDCDGNFVPDEAEITLPGRDTNSNGVLDCCEPGESCFPCPGDVTKGGTVDAADLSILLAAWGTNGQGEFDTDLNGDGLVDGGDLALVLGGWGACP
jgi:hypothetical protein